MVLPNSFKKGVGKRFWLPAVVYECVPYFYILAGFAALFATLYINAWYWMIPHWILFTALCMHAGFYILYKRFRFRRGQRVEDSDSNLTD